MTETILHQGAGFTIARSDAAATLVPYYYAERPDGSVNFGWIDLRGHPDRVSQVPETTLSSGLSDILRTIASPDSPLMSGGCECGAFERHGYPAEMRWQVGGFVTVMFQDADRNRDEKRLVALAAAILRRIGGTTGHHIAFELIIEPLKLFFGHADCYCVTVKPLGYGESEAIARAAFEFAAHGVARSLEQLIKEKGSQPPPVSDSATAAS